MSIRVIVSTVGFLLALACSKDGSSTIDGNPGFTVPSISYKSTRCFGECPLIELTLFEDGRLFYRMQKIDTVGGSSSEPEYAVKELDPEVFQGLAEFIKSMHFEELNDSYVSGRICREYYTDAPTSVYTTDFLEFYKRVEHYHGCKPLFHSNRLNQLDKTFWEVFDLETLATDG